MALSPFQLDVCRLLASRRAPERVPQSYLAGGATLNASEIIEILPLETLGMAVLDATNAPFGGDVAALQRALKRDELRFHAGYIGGAWPLLKAN